MTIEGVVIMLDKFNALVRRMVVESNRPDMVQEIILAIERATLYYHHLDFLEPDYREDDLGISNARSRTFDIPMSVLVGVRRVVSITSYNAHCCPIVLTPNPSYNLCQCSTNWWKRVGNNIKVNLECVGSKLTIGYFRNPIVRPAEAYDSWVIDLYENALFDCAMMYLYLELNDTAQANMYKALVGSVEGRNGHSRVIKAEQIYHGYTNE